MTSSVTAAALVVRKDLLIETRSREVVYTSLLFAMSCMLVFAFGLVKEGRVVADAAAAILWITIAFAGTLALGRVFDRERQNETLRALLLAPAPRAAIYVGKFAGVLALLLLVEAVVVPLVALMFDAPLFRHPAADRWRCWRPAASGMLRSGRCSPRCWRARAAGARCCRCCCIR